MQHLIQSKSYLFFCCLWMTLSIGAWAQPNTQDLSFDQAYQTANQLLSQRRMQDALPYTLRALELSKQYPPGSENYYYHIAAKHQLAIIYANIYQYKEADALYTELLEYYLTTFGNQHQTYLTTLAEMERLYSSMGATQKLIPILEALSRYYESTDFYPLWKAETWTKLGEAYMNVGRNGEAQKLYYQAGALLNQGHTYTFQNVRLLNSFALYCNQVGRGYEAKRYITGALQVAAKVFGTNHHNYISTVTNAAKIHTDLEKYEQADSFLHVAKAYHDQQQLAKTDPFYENYFRAKHTTNIRILKNYSEHRNSYFKVGEDFPDHLNKDAAMLSLAKELLHRYQEHYGVNHIEYANGLIALANLYFLLDRHEETAHMYSEALRIRESFWGSRNSLYTNLLSAAGSAEERIDRIPQAIQRFEEYYDNYTLLLKQNAAVQTEAHRLQFARDKAYQADIIYSFVDRHQDAYPALGALAFNLSNNLKGLALESSLNLGERIKAAQDTILIERFKQWKIAQQNLAKMYTMSTAERKKLGVEIWKQEVTTMDYERQMLEACGEDLRTIIDGSIVEFEAVQAALKPQEVAINFDLSLYHDASKFINEAYYYAMILRPNWKYPKMIRLCSAKELRALLKVEVAPSGRNYIADDIIAEDLYYLTWEKIEPFLENTKVVHISTSSLLNKVSFAALLVDFSSKERLIDRHQIHYYPTLRDFWRKRQFRTAGQADASLRKINIVGGIDFEQGRNTQDSVNAAESRGGDAFGYLRGTAVEMDSISFQFAESCDWQVTTLGGAAAQEQALKAMQGADAPEILHIATHGFFLDPQNYSSKDSSRYEYKFVTKRNPLLRSGLALAGANKAWLDNKRQENGEDGILTALEVSNMNLSGVDLVVLSACETGRGDIDNTEGVMGLQRAFKLAGAKQLIISLWKVPDAQTAELMRIFYRAYLQYEDAPKAFYEAQGIMRKKYRNPYYWAAFILVE